MDLSVDMWSEHVIRPTCHELLQMIIQNILHISCTRVAVIVKCIYSPTKLMTEKKTQEKSIVMMLYR